MILDTSPESRKEFHSLLKSIIEKPGSWERTLTKCRPFSYIRKTHLKYFNVFVRNIRGKKRLHQLRIGNNEIYNITYVKVAKKWHCLRFNIEIVKRDHNKKTSEIIYEQGLFFFDLKTWDLHEMRWLM
jgi:hypothetical protein